MDLDGSLSDNRPNPPNGSEITQPVQPRLGGFARALGEARHRAGISQSELARRARCERSYISMLESGQREEPSKDMMQKLEHALAMAPDELRREAMRLELRGTGHLASAGSMSESALDAAWRSGELARLVAKMRGGLSAGTLGGNVEETRGMLMRHVPLINNVAAGVPTEFTDLGYPARVADEYVAAPMIDDADAFAARVVGDSMEPNYRAGDIVIFSPARTVQSGMDCFVRLEPDQETTFKRVRLLGSDQATKRRSDEDQAMCGECRSQSDEPHTPGRPTPCPLPLGGGEEITHIRLEPLNPKYPARVVEREMVAGMYAAVSVTRKV